MDIRAKQVCKVSEILNEGDTFLKARIITYEGRDRDGAKKVSPWIAFFVGKAKDEVLRIYDEGRAKITLDRAKVEYTMNASGRYSLFVTVFRCSKRRG